MGRENSGKDGREGGLCGAGEAGAGGGVGGVGGWGSGRGRREKGRGGGGGGRTAAAAMPEGVRWPALFFDRVKPRGVPPPAPPPLAVSFPSRGGELAHPTRSN